MDVMEHNMILSASGWRKVFAVSGDEQDVNPRISDDDKAISIAAAKVFYDYIKAKSGQETPVIAIGIDTRPTGGEIADAMIHFLTKTNAVLQFSGITSAPEIMAYARRLDGFIYISASHNPVGHNGIKFGTNDGGVLNGIENAALVKEFLSLLKDDKKLADLVKDSYSGNADKVKNVYIEAAAAKRNSLKAYENFINQTITGTEDKAFAEKFFNNLKAYIEEAPTGVVCDFNGSSRAKCIDREFFNKNGITFYSINDDKIVHEIIPEAENLIYVAAEMERLQAQATRMLYSAICLTATATEETLFTGMKSRKKL